MCVEFLNYINDDSYININVAFNGSSQQKIENAYDLPWILNRAYISMENCNFGVNKWFIGKEINIYYINGFQNAYFIDFK
jgi:hypothetical protein